MNLGCLLESAARQHAGRIAVQDAGRSFTFRQLRDRALRLGNWLLAHGLRPGDRIASLQQNGIETIEVELAASTFGFVRTFLNARGTRDEHIDAVRRLDARALIYGDAYADDAAELRASVASLGCALRVDAGHRTDSAYETALASSSVEVPGYEIDESSPHSVYFSSGTTGRPKAILLSQRTWLALVRNHLVDTYASAGRDDVVLHAAPMSHASGAIVFSHLVRGARQYVLPRFETEAVLDAFEQQAVTTLWVAPTMLYMLLEHPTFGCRRLERLRSVRYGGAPMPVERVRQAAERLGPVLCSGWGQWEAPQQCTFFSQQQIADALAAGDEHRLASVGRSVTFGEVAIADEAGHLLPADTEGEVVVAGDHLMEGYLGQPEETRALRFGKWQRTGDIGRIDADGFVYLTDRKKDLIISGGSNVYPREVEEVLHRHPAVAEAVAIGIPDPKWGEAVHAIVVLRDGHRLTPEALLSWMRGRLADYKRPRSAEFVAEIPKSAYGKVLRREIRAGYWAGGERKI